MRAIFVNRFYYPDETATAQLLTDLAEGLAAQGHCVAVITSRPHEAACPANETRRGVEIHRVRATRSRPGDLPGRVVDFTTFYLFALVRLARCLHRSDTVVALTDPPLLGVFIALLARLKRARCLHWVQDIYPEIAAEVTGHRWLLLLRPFRNLGWRLAGACVLPGEDMRQLAVRTGAACRLVVSENWSPEGLQPASLEAQTTLRRAWGLDGKFVAMYSGNLGRVHDLEPLLEIAAALQDDPEFVLAVVGHGARRPAFEAAAAARRLDNVRFFAPQPRSQLSATLSAADLHLVTLKPGAEHYVFPSKLYGIASVGRPALVVAAPGCELAQTVTRHAFGAAFARTEMDAAIRWIQELRRAPSRLAQLGTAARQFAADRQRQAVATWSSLLEADLAARKESP